LIGAAGILLTMKTVRETIFLELNWLKKFVPKAWRPQEEVAEE